MSMMNVIVLTHIVHRKSYFIIAKSCYKIHDVMLGKERGIMSWSNMAKSMYAVRSYKE